MTFVMANWSRGRLARSAASAHDQGMTPAPSPERAAGVSLAGLEKSYGEIHAVRGVDLHIEPGETVAILGPNGAGKSTTIDMLLGLSRPDRGSVSLFGVDPADAVAAGAIGAMLQTGSLIGQLTIRELVTLTASLYPEPLPVADVLALTGLADIANQRTEKLSGGQTQRVRFAVAIVANPDLLVLDEPTVALDVEGRHAFWGAMRAFAQGGKTVVFATHYLEEADAFADRIVLMAHGRIVADGSSTEIKARVGMKTIRVTLPDAPLAELSALPGVVSAEQHGEGVTLTCGDSDTALRALLAGFADARDIEVLGANLEAAFLALTGDPETATTLEETRR
jgi:ABC-2 type transport system ATP-binding protein